MMDERKRRCTKIVYCICIPPWISLYLSPLTSSYHHTIIIIIIIIVLLLTGYNREVEGVEEVCGNRDHAYRIVTVADVIILWSLRAHVRGAT